MNSTNIMGKEKTIKKLLTSHKLNPHEVIYVGDEIRDIKACRKIGIKIICVDWGYDAIEMLKINQPDYSHLTLEKATRIGLPIHVAL